MAKWRSKADCQLCFLQPVCCGTCLPLISYTDEEYKEEKDSYEHNGPVPTLGATPPKHNHLYMGGDSTPNPAPAQPGSPSNNNNLYMGGENYGSTPGNGNHGSTPGNGNHGYGEA